jgi:peptidyl-prolyl cis-trans isomerase D
MLRPFSFSDYPMLTAFRRYLETWPVRVFFGIMVLAFVVWGVGDVVRQIGTSTWLAKVGGQTIEPQQFEQTFERDMAQAERQLQRGQDVTPALRKQVADQAMQQLIGQVALGREIDRLRIVVPDAALRGAVFAMPAFHGANGQFDRNQFEAALRNANLSEPEFLDLMREQLASQQLLSAVAAGAGAPAMLVRKIFDFEEQQRSALMVELPLATVPAPPAPTPAELQRWYANHPWLYRSPEFRRIKAAVLAPEALAKTLTATDAELHAYYDTHKEIYVVAPRRSVQVAVLQDEAKAKALAAQWSGGADWAAIEKAAQADGGTAVDLDNTTQTGIPDSSLAQAAFSTQPNTVAGPTKTALGWDVLKVTKVTPGTEQSFEQAKPEILAHVLDDKAASQIYDSANKVDDVLGTGAGLDKLPNNLGLVGVQGTLDAKGDTPEGTPAPIPGPPELRKALIEAAFKTPPGQPPAQLTEVPATQSNGASSYFALTVESVTPAAIKPFDTVRSEVEADWTAAARQTESEKEAAKVLTAVHGGQSLIDAATVAGLTVQRTKPVTRDATDTDMPGQLQRVLFGLKPKEPAMVQTPDGFVVAVLDKLETPDPKTDKSAYDEIAQTLARSVAADLTGGFEAALRARANPRVNHSVFDSFVNAQ